MKMSNRIEYIDALRGFVMLLVVLGHVPMYCYHAFGMLSFSQIPSLFHLALFFFVSGWFFTSKSCQKPWGVFIKEKAMQLLLPTVVFYLIFCWVKDVDIAGNLWHDKYKAGYWYCVVLFCFFILARLLGKTKGMGGVVLGIILSAVLLMFNTNAMSRMLNNWGVPNVLCLQQWQYFVFFYMGSMARRNEGLFFSWLDNGKIMGVCIALFFTTLLLFYQQPVGLLGIKVEFLLWGGLGTVLSFTFFRRYASAFHQSTCVGRALQYIGRRTLDVYLLHFFFLPDNMAWLGRHIMGNGNQTVELFISLIIALMVIGLCLLTSSIIRLSPPLAHLLLGTKKV